MRTNTLFEPVELFLGTLVEMLHDGQPMPRTLLIAIVIAAPCIARERMRHRFVLAVHCALPPCHGIRLLVSIRLAHGLAHSARHVGHEQRIDGSRKHLLPLLFPLRSILRVSSEAHLLRSLHLSIRNRSLFVQLVGDVVPYNLL